MNQFYGTIETLKMMLLMNIKDNEAYYNLFLMFFIMCISFIFNNDDCYNEMQNLSSKIISYSNIRV